MPRKARDLRKSLSTKFGFSDVDRGSKHKWMKLALPGLRPVTVMFSHGDTDLGDALLSNICKQLRVSRPYLNGMIDCQRSAAEYRKKLTDENANR